MDQRKRGDSSTWAMGKQVREGPFEQMELGACAHNLRGPVLNKPRSNSGHSLGFGDSCFKRLCYGCKQDGWFHHFPGLKPMEKMLSCGFFVRSSHPKHIGWFPVVSLFWEVPRKQFNHWFLSLCYSCQLCFCRGVFRSPYLAPMEKENDATVHFIHSKLNWLLKT